MGLLYNAFLLQRRAATGCHKGKFSLSLQNRATTNLRAEDPQWEAYSRRLMAETAKQANRAYEAARKAGKRAVRTKNAHHHSTLQVSNAAQQHLRVNADGTKAEIHIKGLPVIRFRLDHRLPPEEQPRIIRITRTPRWLLVSLVFNRPEGPPVPAPCHAVGIDPGVKHLLTAAGSDEEVIQVPGQDDTQHRKFTRGLRRKLQRQRDSVLRDGRARWTSQKTRSGTTRRRFRWEGKPSKGYLKCVARLRRVEQKRSDSLKGIHHRGTTQLVRNYQVVCIEDTRIAQMTRSAKGTVENPGTNIRRKAGLNREILSQSWYQLRSKLEYKCLWQGRQLIPVPAPNTSATCGRCGHTNTGNRRYQASFRCLKCGHRGLQVHGLLGVGRPAPPHERLNWHVVELRLWVGLT